MVRLPISAVAYNSHGAHRGHTNHHITITMRIFYHTPSIQDRLCVGLRHAGLVLVMIVVALASSLLARSQTVAPMSIDFGTVGFLQGQPQGIASIRSITITDTSANRPLLFRFIGAEWSPDGTRNSGGIYQENARIVYPPHHREIRLPPGGSFHLSYGYSSATVGSFHDSVRIISHYEGSSIFDTTVVHIQAKSAVMQTVLMPTHDETDFYLCSCYGAVADELIWSNYIFIYNLLPDTIHVNSLTFESSDRVMVFGHAPFDLKPNWWGSIAVAASGPPRGTEPLAGTEWRAVFHLYAINKRTNEPLHIIEDTVRTALHLQSTQIEFATSNEASVRRDAVDSVSLELAATINCLAPGDDSIQAESITFKGPCQNQLSLLDSPPGTFPYSLTCSHQKHQRISFTGAGPLGSTIDTAWMTFSYRNASGHVVHDSDYLLLYLTVLPSLSAPWEMETTTSSSLSSMPNPASGSVHVRWMPAPGITDRNISIRLYDAAGRDVLDRAIPIDETNTVSIDVSLFSSGMYSAVAYDGRGVRHAVTPIIVTR